MFTTLLKISILHLTTPNYSGDSKLATSSPRMHYAASILYMVIKTPSLYYCCPLGVQHARTSVHGGLSRQRYHLAFLLL